MNILGTEVSLKHKAFEIYLAGCIAPHCPGCHNPESWDFSAGTALTPTTLKKIIATVEDAGDMVENIWVMGGEPLHQPLDELIKLLERLNTTNKKIWLFTRYDSVEDINIRIVNLIDYIKLGPYVKELAEEGYSSHGIPLASTNQYIVALWEI